MGCTCLTRKRKALNCYMIERKCCTNNIVQSGTDCGQITSERMSNIYGLLTKREVKMAEYWPSSFLRVYGKERGQYPAILTEQAWSVKDLLYGFYFGFGEIFLAGHSA